MSRRAIIFLILFVFLITLTGCATGGKQKDLELQGLKNQISVLEAQIQSKDEEINSLREASTKAPAPAEEKTEATKKTGKKRLIGEVKSHPNVKQIQIALKNAGYNLGSLDGRMGKQTKEGIKAFQKANNLREDGKVGRKTWDLLKEYLYKKIK